MIYRGSTPTMLFRYGLEWPDTQAIALTFSQRGQVVLELGKERLTYHDGLFALTLTQEETLAFAFGCVSIQIKAKMRDGIISHSNIVHMDMTQALNQEVI